MQQNCSHKSLIFSDAQHVTFTSTVYPQSSEHGPIRHIGHTCPAHPILNPILISPHPITPHLLPPSVSSRRQPHLQHLQREAEMEAGEILQTTLPTSNRSHLLREPSCHLTAFKSVRWISELSCMKRTTPSWCLVCRRVSSPITPPYETLRNSKPSTMIALVNAA